MFVNGTCPSNGTQIKITNDPGAYLSGLAGERNKTGLDLRVNLASWSEETGAVISVEAV